MRYKGARWVTLPQPPSDNEDNKVPYKICHQCLQFGFCEFAVPPCYPASLPWDTVMKLATMTVTMRKAEESLGVCEVSY